MMTNNHINMMDLWVMPTHKMVHQNTGHRSPNDPKVDKEIGIS